MFTLMYILMHRLQKCVHLTRRFSTSTYFISENNRRVFMKFVFGDKS